MLEVKVNLDDAGAKAVLAQINGIPAARQELHAAMAVAVEENVRGHLLGLDSRSPNTGYYGKAARSVESTADAGSGTVTIPHRGMALRFYGGRVNPVTVRNLALPTANVPIRGGERKRPGEMKDLAWIPKRGGPDVTTGFLVEGETKLILRGPRKGQQRIAPKKGGKLMFVLRGWTDHAPDTGVIPDIPALSAAAQSGAEDYLAAALREGGPA